MIEVVPHSFFQDFWEWRLISEDGRTLYTCKIAYDDDLVAWNAAKHYRAQHTELATKRDEYTCLR